MTDDQDRALAAFQAASKKLANGLTVNAGGNGAEAAYGKAYQALVRAGLAPQIRKKYRP